MMVIYLQLGKRKGSLRYIIFITVHHEVCLGLSVHWLNYFVCQDLIRAHMLNVDEENYKEAVESSYKVSVTPGISKLIYESLSQHGFNRIQFWPYLNDTKEYLPEFAD